MATMKRRSFLKLLGAAIAGAVVAPYLPGIPAHRAYTVEAWIRYDKETAIWHYVVITVAADGGMRTYLNGEPGPIPADFRTAPADAVDNLALYDRPLDEATVLRHFAAARVGW